MRLSPVWVAAVAIAAPLGGTLSANAQSNHSLEQTAEIFTPAINQQSAKDANQGLTSEHVAPSSKSTDFVVIKEPPTSVVAVFPANSAEKQQSEVILPTVTTPTVVPTSHVVVPDVSPELTSESLKQPVSSEVAAFPANSAEKQQSEVILPTLTTQVIAPISKTNPNLVTQQPNSVPDITPPPTQQQVPGTTPGQQPESVPGITPPPTTQQAPATTPGTTPGQQPDTVPDVTPPSTQQQVPGTTPGQQLDTPNGASDDTEPRVLVSEVVVRPETGQLTPELENQVYNVIRTQPGRVTTRTQLQQDINAIFGTGFFANVQAVPEDTPLGVRVSFIVQPNPVLTRVEIQANPGTDVDSVLAPSTVDEVFQAQYGRILNLRELQEGIKQLTQRYQDQGYVLANVIGSPQVSETGVVTLQVAEGVVENVRVRFRDREGQETDETGKPIRGRTQEYIITRELQLQPGQVFNRDVVQRDLQRVFGLGLFEDVNVSLDPGSDPSQVDVVVNVAERSTGSIAAGAGISSASGLFGTVSYQQQNLAGRNQRLGAEVQVGQRELLFDLRFTDPWIAGDPYRTSYTTNLFRRSSISLIFDGQDGDIRTFQVGDTDGEGEGDRPRVLRLGGGVTFTRPLSPNPYERSEWTASAGLQYQRISTRDADGNVRPEGIVLRDGQTVGEPVPLSFSGQGEDDLLLVQLGAQRDLRNNPLQPTTGSFLRFGVDQSVPVGLGSIFLTRLRGSYSQYVPVNLTNFAPGAQTLAFNLQGGTVLGDLPPYEAFTIGGSNSVRGYEEGALTSGRSYVQASVEYRFPVFSVVSGALFFDVGSDLGTTTRPAEVLNKNGTGYGYGLGVRVQSPLGPIRIDYGINDDGDSRINFGIGERF
ncbi:MULTISPECIES: BamA/TamA family outer membrane protein [unclassified Anabaena]|uniref:BamA/TamA family outer membrane protein n=1 Tax=unclassified Anabaena TaxID=2619674 RepID=UPI0039C736E8